MSAATASQILLAFLAGFATPYVLVWIDWRRTRSKRFYE